MAANIRRLARSVFVGFVLVAAGLLYWQIVRAPELVVRDDNPRLVQAEQRLRRGRLLDRQGRVLALSQLSPASGEGAGIVQRRYPYPEAAHAVGYYSLRHGTGGAEAAFDTVLRGELTALDQLLHRPQAGLDVTLSIDVDAQRAAGEGLGGHQGAVAVLDINTGNILVLVSHPAYDPNTLDQDWDELSTDPDAPVLNRVTQGIYPVGDLARWVGLAGLLSAGITTPTDPVNTPLDDMMAPQSDRGYLATARQLGFDRAPPFDLPGGAGVLPDFGDTGTYRDLAVTPLHMARFSAAIAGDGRMPIPGLAYPRPATSFERAFGSDVAASLRAEATRFDGVAGWSGVALPEETGDEPLSWFVGYGPVDTPRFAVAAVVEGSDGGATTSVPIAQQVLETLQ
jgi:peptidoglycan glycosyltransferase